METLQILVSICEAQCSHPTQSGASCADWVLSKTVLLCGLAPTLGLFSREATRTWAIYHLVEFSCLFIEHPTIVSSHVHAELELIWSVQVN